MSTTKEVKALLQELRHELDDEHRAKVEPILRTILDAAKPKTVVEVEYHHDPKDAAEIESLRAVIASKEETIRKLRAKVPAPPPVLERLPFEGMLKEIDNKARGWCEFTLKCMEVTRANKAYRARRKGILHRWRCLSLTTLGNYLSHLEGCGQLDEFKLKAIVDGNCVQALKQIADDIRAETGKQVDLALSLRNEGKGVVSVAKAAEQSVILVGVDGAASKPPRASRPR